MQKRTLYVLIAVIVAVVIVGAAAAIILTAPPKKLTIDLWYNSDGHYGDTEPAVAQVIKSSLEATGKLTVNLKSEPWATYTDDFGNGRLPFFLLGWYPDYFDSDDYVSPFLSTSGGQSLGSNYSSAQMDTWLAQEAASASDSARSSTFQSIQNQLATDVPYIPLWQGNAHVVYKTSVSGVYLHPVTFKWFVVNKTGANSLTVGTTDRVVSFDPAKEYDYFSGEIVNQVFDTLLVYDTQTTTLMPGLATEVPTVANGGISANGLNYTFHLRHGVTFQDGSAFNATVMKWSIERAIHLDLSGSPAFLLYDVGNLSKNPDPRITIPPGDDYNITFHLQHPVGFFNSLMAFTISAPVSMLAYNNTGQQPDQLGRVVGTGPYKLTGYTPNNQIILTKFANYYNPGLYASKGIPTIPVLNTVTITLYSSATNLKNDISTGAIDIAYRTLNPTDLTNLQSQASTLGIKVDIGSSPQIRYLVINVKTPPFNDARLRQAIAYAVNRTAIANTVFSGLVTPIYSMVPPSMPYSQPVFQTSYGSTPNLTQANNLLAQMGYTLFQANAMARIRS
jgi:ABC-type transport system substrate-binding protein